MRILIVTQYFFPETGGTSNRIGAFARHLSAVGHDVHVLAEKPNHPHGVFFDGYEEGLFVEDVYEGVPVTHCWVWTRPDKGFADRLLFYLSFMVMSVIGAARLRKRYDVVLASSPPLPVGPAGWLISFIANARFVFDVRDLWPDVALAMGELPDGLLASLASRVERFLYRRADAITAVTEGFCEIIRQRAPRGTPIIRVANGTMPEQFRIAESKEHLRANLDLPDDFLITYAGNIGLAQGLQHVLDAAETLERDGDEVTFLLLGDGALRDELEADSHRRGLEKVEFRDRVPLEQAARYMAASDALLVPLKDRPIFDRFIPSKLFDSMAAGRPILLSVDGEARDILEKAGAGLYYPAEDAEALVDCVRQLLTDDRVDALGAAGRRFVNTHFTREKQSRLMFNVLEKVARNRPTESSEHFGPRG